MILWTVQEDVQYLEKAHERLLTFNNRLYDDSDNSIIKKSLAKKLSDSGWSFSDLRKLYLSTRPWGVTALLANPPSTSKGKSPRGTNSCIILQKIIDFLKILTWNEKWLKSFTDWLMLLKIIHIRSMPSVDKVTAEYGSTVLEAAEKKETISCSKKSRSWAFCGRPLTHNDSMLTWKILRSNALARLEQGKHWPMQFNKMWRGQRLWSIVTLN